MESMRKKPRCRRSFTPEFKAEIVELCQRGDRPIGQVANYFDLIQMAVREWVKRAGRDAGTWRDGEPCPMDSKRFTGSATRLFDPADAAGTETVGTHIASICAKGSAYWIAVSDGT